MNNDVASAILKLAGRDPLPWLQLLHPSSAAGGEKASNCGSAAARDDVEDQGLRRDQQAATTPCAPSAILEAWPGFSGDEGCDAPPSSAGDSKRGIPLSLAREPWGVAACLALAAQCRDDEVARYTVWSRPESLQPVLAMLKVGGALGGWALVGGAEVRAP